MRANWKAQGVDKRATLHRPSSDDDSAFGSIRTKSLATRIIFKGRLLSLKSLPFEKHSGLILANEFISV